MRNQYGFKQITLPEAKKIVKRQVTSNVKDGFRNGTSLNIYNLIAYQEYKDARISYFDVESGKNYILLNIPNGYMKNMKTYRNELRKQLSKNNMYRYLHTIREVRYGVDRFEMVCYDTETNKNVLLKYKIVKEGIFTSGVLKLERL